MVKQAVIFTCSLNYIEVQSFVDWNVKFKILSQNINLFYSITMLPFKHCRWKYMIEKLYMQNKIIKDNKSITKPLKFV